MTAWGSEGRPRAWTHGLAVESTSVRPWLTTIPIVGDYDAPLAPAAWHAAGRGRSPICRFSARSCRDAWYFSKGLCL
jgi:hypothetical protein